MDVYIDIFLGPSYHIIEVDKEHTVYDIKMKIEEALGIPTCKQLLFLKVDEDKFLLLRSHYEIKYLCIFNKFRIHLFFPLRKFKKDIDSQVASSSNQIEEFLYGPARFEMQIPTSTQDLTQMLIGDFVFNEYGIISSEEIRFIRKALISSVRVKKAEADGQEEVLVMDETMMIVKIASPYDRMEVVVDAFDKVEILWKEIETISQYKFGWKLTKDEYVLKHKEKTLVEDESFASNGLSQHDTIEFIPIENVTQGGESSTTQEDQA